MEGNRRCLVGRIRWLQSAPVRLEQLQWLATALLQGDLVDALLRLRQAMAQVLGLDLL